ncbi:class I SAM-dependent methyltransferase [Jannaschia rubra]|uniref:class I SAM-dependent methyltransferase n=1 Tax=Jannaschia rubra TaxID=282197 RepID=UPI0024910135|nr:class I SAM-dependent methyltransferase [Jannaschia rubra]
MSLATNIAGGLLALAPAGLRTRLKEEAELHYWRRVLRKSGGTFYNGHFRSRFTDLFDLPMDHFAGKRMLDLGCGPLGSLEWADMAADRVGVDPLADRYVTLNGGTQAMRYVRSGCETLPFGHAAFDVVSMFNALDHVEDVEASVAEMQRVLAPGGDLLLIVEIDHPATVTEPHRLREDLLRTFDRCLVRDSRVFAIRDDHDVYRSLRDARPRRRAGDPAILCARLQRQA